MSKKDKNNDNSINSIVNNAGYFLLTILILTIIVCIHFSFGSFILFACKVAQSNILPTDIQCKPYSENSPDIKPVSSNIFVTKPPKMNEQMSQKIKFPYNEKNSKNLLIDIFRGFKDSPESFFLVNYFISIFEYLLCFNYYAMNMLFGFFNNYLSESLILVLGPLFLPVILSFMLIINHLYIMFLWFEKMSWFFKKNVNDAYEGRKPEWKNISILDPFGYLIGIFLVFVFFILFFIVGIAVFPLIAFFTIVWVLFSISNFTGIMDDKEVSFLGIIKKVFKYHKVTFMVVLTFLIILSAFTNLGSVGGLVCLVAALCMYFRIVPSNIFIPEIPLGLSALVSDSQAKKTCRAQKTSSKHGFIYNLLFPQNGGAELVQQIKNISSKLKG